MFIKPYTPLFKGIKPPYTEAKSGMRIFPLSEDISVRQARQHLAEIRLPDHALGTGFNGMAYVVGQPFRVIKVHKGDAAAVVKDDEQEVQKLDLLYKLLEHHGQNALGNSQTGIVAFKPKAGAQHILSTFVPGGQPDPVKNPLTASSLQSLIEKIIVLDKGTPELGRFMHFDLSGTNINTTPDNAGIFDWEYLGTQRLDNTLGAGLAGKKSEACPCNPGDTSYADSNLRNTEFRLIYPYLRDQLVIGKSKPAEVRNVFETYIHQKVGYHEAMAEHYQRMLQNPPPDLKVGRPAYERELKRMARAEKAHARLLKGTGGKTPDDILKAELAKIQLAYYTYITGPFCADGQFNGKQVGELYDSSKQFFTTQLQTATEAGDHPRKIYYKNGLMLIDVMAPALHSGRPADGVAPARSARLADPLQPDMVEILYGNKVLPPKKESRRK